LILRLNHRTVITVVHYSSIKCDTQAPNNFDYSNTKKDTQIYTKYCNDGTRFFFHTFSSLSTIIAHFYITLQTWRYWT